MKNPWTPWTDYQPLTQERLSIVAQIIRQARRDTLILFDPLGGDNSWSHGCRAYVRSIFALTEASKKFPWLTVVPEVERLRSTFAIGGIPFRFYRGIAEEPPTHYLATTFGEVRQLQWALKIDGLRPIDRVLRIAIETDAQGETTEITLVEVDEAGNITNSYPIPLATAKSNVILARAVAIDLPAPTVEAKRNEDQKVQDRKKDKKKNG
jgi:hypothetical protein